MPELLPRPTLQDFQTYVTRLETERGFSDQTALQKCLLLGEEVGELFKAVRKAEGLAIDVRSKVGSVGEELADVLIYLCSIANRFDVDLEEAFRRKEEENHRRSWSAASGPLVDAQRAGRAGRSVEGDEDLSGGAGTPGLDVGHRQVRQAPPEGGESVPDDLPRLNP
jgi:NTP pyrophosphatase (non-canonical NTP hydrolase)